MSGAAHELELRMPTTGEMFALLLPRSLRTEARMQVLGRAEIKRMLRRIDGREVDISLAREVYADRQAFAQYAATRTRWLEGFVESGTVWAECPHCRSWRADLKPLAYGVGLRTAFWPVSDDGVFLAVPSLAKATPRGHRPARVALTSALTFELPSSRPGTPGTIPAGAFHLGDTSERENRAWLEFAPPGSARPEGREQWREDVPGFRAVLRLSAALDRLDGKNEQPTPADLMDMAFGDFLFLDNVHYLAHDVTVPEDHGLAIRCANCRGDFLPLL